MGGFVVTCVDKEYYNGVKEVLLFLKMAVFHIKNQCSPAADETDPKDIQQQLKKEKEEMKKIEFTLLGGKRDSDILFIRNDTEYSEIEIYNMMISLTTRAEHVRRIIPVNSIFTYTMDNLLHETKKVCASIGLQESFRISLSKRLCSHVSSEYIITMVAAEIPRKVDLKTPDKVVMIEIVKDLCAIGALKPCPGNFNITRAPRKQ
ncbi:hypothetical protein NEIG_00262 [Nematocida sp. ERTm5]|nr:hypothetical protein NEIG_00262 [Nematocida sp. ERTm5]